MLRLIPLAALAVLAGCADSEPPDAAQTDESGAYNMVQPVTAKLDAEEAAPAIGEWRRSMLEEKPALLFGPADTEPLFSLRCAAGGGLLLQRHGAIAIGSGEQMKIASGGQSEQRDVEAVQGPPPLLRAALAGDDALVARIAEARQPIEVAIGAEPALVMKSDPLIGEFVRSCAGETAAAGSEAAKGAAPEGGTPAN
ncbi:hypothetical protein [Allosphingosinicella humi]